MTHDVTRRTVLKLAGASGVAGVALGGTAGASPNGGGGGVAEVDLDHFHRKTPWYVFDSFEPFEDFVTCMARESADRPLYFYLAEYVGTDELTVVITAKALDESGVYQFTSTPTPCRVVAEDFPNGLTAYSRIE